ARGKIVKDAAGTPAFQGGAKQSFAFVPNELSKSPESLAGSPGLVAVRGGVYKKTAGNKKPSPGKQEQLTVLEIEKRGGMTKERGVVLSLGIAGLAGCGGRPAPSSAKPVPAGEIGSKLPDFSVKDFAGRDLSSRSLAGKVVLIDFWATWCEP